MDDTAFGVAWTDHRRRVPRLRPYRISVASLLGSSLGAALGALVGVGVDVLVAPGSRAEAPGLVVGGAAGLFVACMICVLDRIGERRAARLTDDEVAASQETTSEMLEDTGPLQLAELPPEDSIT